MIKDLNKQLEKSHEKGGELLKLNLDKKEQIKRMGEHISKLEHKLLNKKKQLDNVRKELARQFLNPYEDDSDQ